MCNTLGVFDGTTGKIVKVCLRNFLNHESLVFECSPNFNVIFGKNGRRSIIIQKAIALCFGSEGKNAGRNSTLANYIKDYHLPEAQNRIATIEVTLSNSGPDAFEFESRGPFFTVSRYISKNSSTYYMKGSAGKREQVSRRKLKEYLNQVKINIKNPIVYMDQELSKSFFLHATNHNFYNYYMSAGGLDTMYDSMALEKSNLEQTKLEIERRQTSVVPERGLLKEFCQSVSQFEDQIEEWERAKLNYRLAELRDAKLELEKYSKLLKDAENSDINEEIKKLENEIILTKNQIGNTKYQLECLVSQAVNLRETIKNQNEITTSFETQIFQLNNHMKNIEKEIDEVNLEISQIDSQELDNKNTILSIEKKKHELLQNELKKLNDELYKVELEYDSTNSGIISVESELRQMDFTKKNIMDKLYHVRGTIRRISCKNNRETFEIGLNQVYNYNVASVINKIDKMAKSSEFKIKPLGPIGQLIKLKPYVNDIKIPSIIERHIGKLVFSYLVASEHDSEKIRHLLESNSCPHEKIRIIKTNLFNSTLDKSMDEPKTVTDNILYNYLDTSEMDKVLTNFLVKSHNFLTTAIFKNYKDMYNTLSNPKNHVQIGFTLDRVGHGKRINDSLFFPACNENDYKPPKFINISSTGCKYSIESYMKSEVEFIESLEEAKKKYNELSDKRKSFKKKIDQLKQEKTNLYKEKFILESKLSQINNNDLTFIDKDNNSLQSKLKKKLYDLQCKLKLALDKLNDVNQNKTSHLENIKNNSTLLDTVLHDVSQLKKSHGEWKVKLENLYKTLDSTKKSKEHFLESIAQLKSNCTKSRDKILLLERKMATSGIDIDKHEMPKLTMQEYYNMIEARKVLLKKMVKDNISQGKTRASTIQDYIQELKNERDQFKQKLQIKEEKLKEIIENFTLSKQNFHMRSEKFSKIKQKIKNIAKQVFKSTLISVCDYQGNLVFNDIQRTLDIQIFNKQQPLSKTHVATNLKTLSGGERSCIQLSLLKSLASITYSPVHIFDELDVYMDQSTRMRNIDELLDFAVKNPNRQFFLVTPHYEFARHISDSYSHISKLFNVGPKL